MSTSNRRRTNSRQHTVEDEALSEVAREAEERLAAKRAARTEAREIRIRELERQQLEDQERERVKNNGELKKDFSYTPQSKYSSRRGSDDVSEDLKKELYDLHDKYVKTMTHNAQLDNDKQTLTFRVSLLTDDLDDLSEANIELKRQLKDKTRDFDHKKKNCDLLQATVTKLQEELQQRDVLIQEHGLIFVSDDVGSSDEDDDGQKRKKKTEDGHEQKKRCALVSQKAVEVLQGFSGTLDNRLLQMDAEKQAMEKLIKKLKHDLDEERERRSVTDRFKSHSPTPNRNLGMNNGGNNEGKSDMDLSAQGELKKQLSELKIKLNKAHQELATYEGSVARLEAQVKRYKSTAESAERNEEDLRSEKRKLQKELRDCQSAKCELEVERNHLQKRLEKSKTFKSK